MEISAAVRKLLPSFGKPPVSPQHPAAMAPGPRVPLPATGANANAIAWGAKVSPEFRTKVVAVAKQIQCDANHLMACMAFETGHTFSPAQRNAASGATGLIQFMPNTAKGLGTTVEKLARMSAVDQLDYVLKYFKPWVGKLASLSDLYMAVLAPVAIGKADSTAIYSAPSIQYEENKGLDHDQDGAITKAEATGHVQSALQEGMQPPNFA
jgi:hypothetical protein